VTRPNFQETAVCHFCRLPDFGPTEESARTKGGRFETIRAEKKPCIQRCVKWLTHRTGSERLFGHCSRSLGSVGDTEGAMPRYDLWACRILPRIGLDQRSREARLQLERIEWLLIPPAAGKRRLFGDGRGGDGTLQRGRIRRLLKARSSRVPPIVEMRRMEMTLSQVSPKPC
jgi:hypothetical protein